MLRTVVRLTPAFAIPIFNENRHKNDILLSKTVPTKPETGWGRVKQMYTESEQGEISLELSNVFHTTMNGTFLGACSGGLVFVRRAYLHFMENTPVITLKQIAQAKKPLHDCITKALARGAYKWGSRLCLCTAIFSLTTATISVYFGNTSLIEYITAGTLIGALCKIDLGLGATFVGAGLGATLSTIGGLAILGLLELDGLSIDEIRKALNQVKEASEDQALEKSATIKNDEMTASHNGIVKEHCQTKIEEIS